MADSSNPSTEVQTPDPSKNALKKGIFTNALLEGEDPQAVEVIVEDVINRFEVDDASGEIYARRFVQTTRQINRLNKAQIDYVEGYMQSELARQEFCRQVGISTIFSKDLPDWYFTAETKPREEAMQILKILKEAERLVANYSVDLITRAKGVVPNLWRFLMGEEGGATQKVHTFGDRLASLYKKPTPQENLKALIEIVEHNYEYELQWAKSSQRFDSIVQGIRGQATMEAMSNPNWARADSLYHRRSQDLVQTLVSLKHEKATKTQQVLEMIEPIKTSNKPARKSKRIKSEQSVIQDA